jgi:hypothetical protein
MPIATLTKVTTPTAQQICALATTAGFKITAPEQASPTEYLNGLLGEKKLEAAVQFLAFALPAREAVWWVCVCARAQLAETTPQPVLQAIEAAETWVRKPTEEHRRAAMACAQATDFQSPAAWAAVAAFWSGGSMSPPNLPEVPAPPHLLGSAVAGAVTLAAVQLEPGMAEQKRERFVAAAVEIANGGTGRLAVQGA